MGLDPLGMQRALPLSGVSHVGWEFPLLYEATVGSGASEFQTALAFWKYIRKLTKYLEIIT